MFAIVSVKGDQERVEIGRKILTPFMPDKNPGDEVILDNIMLISEDGEVTVGQPFIEGVSFKAVVVDHTRGKKVIAFKKKRRTGYKRKIGHVQNYTELEILEMLRGDQVTVAATENTNSETVDEHPEED